MIKKLSKRGTLMLIVIIFVLIFSSVAVTLELSLLQRVEGRRYAQRNDGIYTADALMDVYIYENINYLKRSLATYTVTPMTDEETLDELVKELGEDLTLSWDSDKKHQFTLPDIYSMVANLQVDNPDILESMMKIMLDQVKIDNSIPASDPFRIDWENPETVWERDPEDIFMLKPIRVTYKEYFKSYSVEKTVVFYNVFLETEGEGPQFTLRVNTDRLEILVEEYNCYE